RVAEPSLGLEIERARDGSPAVRCMNSVQLDSVDTSSGCIKNVRLCVNSAGSLCCCSFLQLLHSHKTTPTCLSGQVTTPKRAATSLLSSTQTRSLRTMDR